MGRYSPLYLCFTQFNKKNSINQPYKAFDKAFKNKITHHADLKFIIVTVHF